jgi:uncharacterized membrane protein/Leucine-rich repeat (LRR) protein
VHLPAWLEVLGRMHPMFLHFPITLLLMYFVVFWIPANESAASWIRVIGFIAAFSAVIAAIMGMLLSMQETFEGSTFQRHKLGGITIALVAAAFYYSHRFLINHKTAGRICTVLSAVLILLTAHWGGSLTHGEGYLMEPYARTKKEIPLSQAIAFEDIVQPVLQAKCGTCHSDGNSKGGLSIEDSAGVMTGGKTGPFLYAGYPDSSLFIQRILLPLSDKKHMSPASKPQLTDEEFRVLSAWVKAGAPMHKKIIDLPTKDSFRLLAARSLLPLETSEQNAYTFAAADEKTIAGLNNNYRVVSPKDQHSPGLEVQFYGSKAYTPKSLEDLLVVKSQVVDLGIAKMPIKNNELKIVEQMPNLEKLNINYTDITDEGIVHLIKLKNLKEVALSGTPMTATALEQLLKIPSMQTVFVWNTSIDSNKIAVLQRKYKNVRIETGFVDDGQNMLPLNPPVAQTIPGVYAPGKIVNLTHPLKGVEIRYTLDGSEPDSVHSAVYSAPFTLNTFTMIRAKAYKPKWYGSKMLNAAYYMKGPIPDSVSVVSDEGENRGKGKILFDLETGGMNVGSGKWIGFKKPLLCYVFFNEPVQLHKLWVNMFVDNRIKLLLPGKIEIWGGPDKNNLKLLKTWKSDPPEKDHDPQLTPVDIGLPETKIKCIELIMQPLAIKNTDVRCFISEIVLQ